MGDCVSIPNQKPGIITLIEWLLGDQGVRHFKAKVFQGQWRLQITQGQFLILRGAALFIQIIVCGLGYSPAVLGQPAFVFASDTNALMGTPRAHLVAIYNQGTPDRPNFRMARPDVLPVGQDGKMIWFSDNSWRTEGLRATDRIILEQDMLGVGSRQTHVFAGCRPARGERLELAGRVVWLASCDENTISRISPNTHRVVFEPKTSTVASRFYRYTFKPTNHMLFDRVIFSDKMSTVVASDSDLYIRSDIKNFFTLNFNSKDIESRLEQQRAESLSQLASLGFYLRVLFFRLTLDLRTDVAFFESSANIPMVMTLPVNASKRLNRKSGVLYSFKLGKGVDATKLRAAMPILNPDLLGQDISQIGLSSCDRLCEYMLEIPTLGKSLELRITVSPELAKKGLFPWFVADVKSLEKAMNWSLPPSLDLENRLGLYLEVSGLPKGSHPWDFWMSFK
jgi:hypothetical protein